MFVLLKGATKEQAFKIGQEIAEAVTATNPKPVKLKFEKVLGGGKALVYGEPALPVCLRTFIWRCATLFSFLHPRIRHTSTFFCLFPGVPALCSADEETLCGLHV